MVLVDLFLLYTAYIELMFSPSVKYDETEIVVESMMDRRRRSRRKRKEARGGLMAATSSTSSTLSKSMSSLIALKNRTKVGKLLYDEAEDDDGYEAATEMEEELMLDGEHWYRRRRRRRKHGGGFAFDAGGVKRIGESESPLRFASFPSPCLTPFEIDIDADKDHMLAHLDVGDLKGKNTDTEDGDNADDEHEESGGLKGRCGVFIFPETPKELTTIKSETVSEETPVPVPVSQPVSMPMIGRSRRSDCCEKSFTYDEEYVPNEYVLDHLHKLMAMVDLARAKRLKKMKCDKST